MSAPERLLRLAEVEERVARKKSWIYAEIDAGRFPPADDGRWHQAEIAKYLSHRRKGEPTEGMWPERIDPTNRCQEMTSKHPKRDYPTCLYRHFNSAGRLLYVGVSLSTLQRTAHHRACASWALQIRRIDVEWFPNREAAMRAELKAIWQERPKYNKANAIGGGRGKR